MVKLSVDPELRRRFQENPAEVLSEAELSEEELDLVARAETPIRFARTSGPMLHRNA